MFAFYLPVIATPPRVAHAKPPGPKLKKKPIRNNLLLKFITFEKSVSPKLHAVLKSNFSKILAFKPFAGEK